MEGTNCDHCPAGWVLVVNDTRAVKPEWKTFFQYEEGCFECSSCVEDVVLKTDLMEDSLRPVIDDFREKKTAFFARQVLKFEAAICCQVFTSEPPCVYHSRD